MLECPVPSPTAATRTAGHNVVADCPVRGDRRPVYAAAVARIATTVVAPFTAVLVATTLSPGEQGIWYTMASIIGIASYAELGAGQVLMQFAAAEWPGFVAGDRLATRRLSCVAIITLRWSAVVAIAVACTSAGLGWAVLSRGVASPDSWEGPLFALSGVASLNVACAFVNGFLEGCQRATAAYLRRAAQSIGYGLTATLALVMGAGLWAAAIGQAASLLIAICWIFLENRSLFAPLFAADAESAIRWRRDVLPLQMRYAAVWATGAVQVHGLTPVVFAMIGADAAGRFGLSMSLLSVLSALSQVSIAGSAAKLGSLAATGARSTLEAVYTRAAQCVRVLHWLGAAAVIASVALSAVVFPRFAARLLDVPALTVLLAGQRAIIEAAVMTALIRSFRREPFVTVAWASALAGLFGVAAGALTRGEMGACIGYAVAQWAFFPMWRKVYSANRAIVLGAER